MLRIDVHQEKTETNLILTGKLMGPWVTELEKCWQSVTAAAPNQPKPSRLPVVVDLSKVTFIDESGKQLVVQMCQRGIRLVGTGLIAEFICREIKAAARKCEPLAEDCPVD